MHSVVYLFQDDLRKRGVHVPSQRFDREGDVAETKARDIYGNVIMVPGAPDLRPQASGMAASGTDAAAAAAAADLTSINTTVPSTATFSGEHTATTNEPANTGIPLGPPSQVTKPSSPPLPPQATSLKPDPDHASSPSASTTPAQKNYRRKRRHSIIRRGV
jgi:hypothetical protein